jgi:hypothetical protein
VIENHIGQMSDMAFPFSDPTELSVLTGQLKPTLDPGHFLHSKAFLDLTPLFSFILA